MADHPWRCSQCGTINEPVANSCRTCGKWPSLFDLEDNVVDDADVEAHAETAPAETYEAPEPQAFEPTTFEAPTFEPATVDAGAFEEPESAQPKRRWGPPPTEPVLEEGEAEGSRRWLSWLVPLAFVGYVVLSYFFSSR
jgi:hypothetical protein